MLLLKKKYRMLIFSCALSSLKFYSCAGSAGSFKFDEEYWRQWSAKWLREWLLVPCGAKLWHRSWWRHQMETFSVLLAICAGNSPFPGEFFAQRPVTRSFNVFFDLRLNKRLSKQSWGWWFETLSRPLWRHRNDIDRKWFRYWHWLLAMVIFILLTIQGYCYDCDISQTLMISCNV